MAVAMRTALRALVAATALALGCRALAPPAAKTPPLDDAALAQVDAILAARQRELHIPGLAFAIVKGGEVVYLKAMGLRDVERNLPATVDTLFPIGSCTKAFTSMAVALGEDEGLLTLDDPPRKFLPYFKMAAPDADAQVNLRDMLSHRTGLKAYADSRGRAGGPDTRGIHPRGHVGQAGRQAAREVPVLECDVLRGG